MTTVKIKTFPDHVALSNEIQRRAEIILSANRVGMRKVDFEDVFFVGSRNGFMTFKGNRHFVLAKKVQEDWVMPETYVAACARHLAWHEMRAARMQSLDAVVNQLDKAQAKFLEDNVKGF